MGLAHSRLSRKGRSLLRSLPVMDAERRPSAVRRFAQGHTAAPPSSDPGRPDSGGRGLSGASVGASSVWKSGRGSGWEGASILEQVRGAGHAEEEWPDAKDWSLQDTDAFVLVYDICSPDSFDYVKALRQRIAETRPAGAPEAPILVVGNKRDRQRLRFGPRRALAALVRRGWRCGYLECSAKYNWHVLRLFRELLRCALVRARPAHPALRLQGALHPARCSLM
ncbi:ras-like protein family member 10A isoform X1 [Gorilla gorilla gorilla]|uniref:ras-like protein family member 10A isoform X1 n=1 Tax=Gorilla gorilla gorilla TaxID=9595 RepID=UPI0008F4F405|nr:ras-like protein family member 10A isoform X1 [Gorilla gorilla gorilla]XP_055230103.1 ras-like protein family member 10A isoform X1 [Gorilla gorilla gorilla]